jgi:transcriptional regulator with XRE-family HTH domain
LKKIKSPVAGNIVKYRTLAGLTQSELAEKIGIQLSGIQKYEYSVGLPSIPALIALAKALNVRPSQLIDNEQDVANKPTMTYTRSETKIDRADYEAFAEKLGQKPLDTHTIAQFIEVLGNAEQFERVLAYAVLSEDKELLMAAISQSATVSAVFDQLSEAKMKALIEAKRKPGA